MKKNLILKISLISLFAILLISCGQTTSQTRIQRRTHSTRSQIAVKPANIEESKQKFEKIYKVIYVIDSGSRSVTESEMNESKLLAQELIKENSRYGQLIDAIFRQNINIYDSIINSNKDFAEAYLFRGNLKAAQGNYSEALKDYNMAIKLKPHDARIYFNRGNSYRLMEDHNSAMKDYFKTIELDSYFTRSYVNIAALYVKKNDRKNALIYLDKASKINKNILQIHYNYAMIYGGMAHDIYKKQNQSQRNTAHIKRDDLLMKAHISALNSITLVPNEKQGYVLRIWIYSLMPPSLRGSLYNIEKMQGLNLPNPDGIQDASREDLIKLNKLSEIDINKHNTNKKIIMSLVYTGNKTFSDGTNNLVIQFGNMEALKGLKVNTRYNVVFSLSAINTISNEVYGVLYEVR